MAENVLYYGDNLDILRNRDYFKDESIDLIYLDPPFKSNQAYNVIFEERNGSESKAQIQVFEDTWHWGTEAEKAYQEIVESGPQRVSQVMQAFRKFLGITDMMAYLAMMAPRIVELHRVLKPTGSIYLHCDPTASHYLKMLMDAVFNPTNFRNEIVWHYRRWTAVAKKFQRLHDIILFYTKTDNYIFNKLLIPYTAGSVKRKMQGILHRFKRGEEPVLVSNKEVQAEGVPENDVWQIPFIAPSAKERLGYQTQKPEALLEKIIQASSNEGDAVLDPFCGCGTTVAVAQKLNRRWIGIDITHLAIGLIRDRLQDAFGTKIIESYEVIGVPTDISGAKELAKSKPYQFQCWALWKATGRTAAPKKGPDEGIDGRLYFHDEPEGGKTKQIVFSVKSGHTGPADVRELRGVIEREEAEIGVFICMQKATKAMRSEAASAGFYKSTWGTKHPALQILIIEELLNGKIVDYPHFEGVNVTFKKAPKAKSGKSKTQMILSQEEERKHKTKKQRKSD